MLMRVLYLLSCFFSGVKWWFIVFFLCWLVRLERRRFWWLIGFWIVLLLFGCVCGCLSVFLLIIFFCEWV